MRKLFLSVFLTAFLFVLSIAPALAGEIGPTP
jgi:hypothetical protein